MIKRASLKIVFLTVFVCTTSAGADDLNTAAAQLTHSRDGLIKKESRLEIERESLMKEKELLVDNLNRLQERLTCVDERVAQIDLSLANTDYKIKNLEISLSYLSR